MQLELRLYKNAELAEWFDIKESTFRSRKRQKLEELKAYARFQEVKGKVQILEVFEPIYVKKTSSNYRLIAELTAQTWDISGFDTCAHICQQLQSDERVKHLSDSTRYEYIRRAHNETHGSPAKKNGGTKGMCYYKWGKRHSKNRKHPVYFSDEEQQYFYELIKEVFKTDPKEEAERQALRQAYKNKEISQEEYYEQRDILDEARGNKWVLVEQGMYDKFHIELIRGTQEDFQIDFEC